MLAAVLAFLVIFGARLVLGNNLIPKNPAAVEYTPAIKLEKSGETEGGDGIRLSRQL